MRHLLPALTLAALLAAPAIAQSNQDATRQHEKTDKTQTKADKAGQNTGEQKKADKTRDKANKEKTKEPPVQYDPVRP